MRKVLFFLVLPIVFVITRLYYVDNVFRMTSYILFIIINCGISVGAYVVFGRVLKNKVTWWLLAMFIIGCVGMDQFSKLIVDRYDINCNVIGELVTIKPTPNLHQAAMLNFLNVELDTFIIVVFKMLLVLAMLCVFVKRKNKSHEVICAFILLMSAGVATVIDSICWGYTLDYIYFYKLTCYDVKDFYVDIAIGYILIEFFNTKIVCNTLRKY